MAMTEYRAFIDKYNILTGEIADLQRRIAEGSLTAADARLRIKNLIAKAKKLYDEVGSYILLNRVAITQEQLTVPFNVLKKSIEDNQIDKLDDIESDIPNYGIIVRRTEAQLQTKFTTLQNTLKALQTKVKNASTSCRSNKKDALSEFDATFPEFIALNDDALGLVRQAKVNGFTAIESAAQAFAITVSQEYANAVKARTSCQNRQPTTTSGTDANREEIANQFQALQAQTEVASNNCPIDKEASLASFEAIFSGYTAIFIRIGDLKKEALANKNTEKHEALRQLAVSIQAGLEAAKVARDACKNLTANTTSGLQGKQASVREEATRQDAINAKLKGDWRVRLVLAPEADGYLYRVPPEQAGILAPLQETEGVIFPYTPDISIGYTAKYDTLNPVHSNYNIIQYQYSTVDALTINCEFTAQDNKEAGYLLAVIHFFRSATKMFYGQDQNPKPGTPPPLCYLYGLGEFQFNNHPLVISGFTYQLPTDVDYIRTTPYTTTAPGTNKNPAGPAFNVRDTSDARLQTNGQKISRNGNTPPANFSQIPNGSVEPTYVPTKMKITITCLPIVSRNNVSKNFSFRDYATGKLLQGNKNRTGGFW